MVCNGICMTYITIKHGLLFHYTYIYQMAAWQNSMQSSCKDVKWTFNLAFIEIECQDLSKYFISDLMAPPFACCPFGVCLCFSYCSRGGASKAKTFKWFATFWVTHHVERKWFSTFRVIHHTECKWFATFWVTHHAESTWFTTFELSIMLNANGLWRFKLLLMLKTNDLHCLSQLSCWKQTIQVFSHPLGFA